MRGGGREFARRRRDAAAPRAARALRTGCAACAVIVLGAVLGAWLHALTHATYVATQAGRPATLAPVRSKVLQPPAVRGGAVPAESLAMATEKRPPPLPGADGPVAGKLVLYSAFGCEGEVVKTFSKADDHSMNELHGLCDVQAKSMRLEQGDEVDFFSSCNNDRTYVGSLFRSEGCVRVYSYPVARSFKFVTGSSLVRQQIPEAVLAEQWDMQDHRPVAPEGPPKARIVFSCESAEYFGYQVWANYLGYLSSKQSSASWTRLLTARERDDLPDYVNGLATFQAKRTLYSRRYSPINKPDVISKWFASPDRPKEDVIVVIDPDNWLLKDVSKYVDQVSEGHAVAEPAYYMGSRSAQRMWKELCKSNCDRELDLVGVPYFVHRDDLAKIAPLWRQYTIEIKDRTDKDPAFKDRYSGLDPSWAAEMFGYNMASAHAGVKHKAVQNIQIRDVASEHRHSKLGHIAMLHVGRAWLPEDYEPGKAWEHTEGKSFRHHGRQVWCKCNNTAADVRPWPIPPEADFQSTHTLRLLHDSYERFGNIPVNKRYRKGSGNKYHLSVD